MIPLWMFPMAVPRAIPSCSSPPSKIPMVTMRLCELALWKPAFPGRAGTWCTAARRRERHLRPPGHQAISFVGSTKVGTLLQPRQPGNGKRVVHDGREEPRHRAARREQGADPQRHRRSAVVRRRRSAALQPAGGDAGGRAAKQWIFELVAKAKTLKVKRRREKAPTWARSSRALPCRASWA